MEILPGGIITSVKHLSEETGLTLQQVRTAINKLKSTNEITSETTNTFTHIQVQNWARYQNELTNTLTNEQQTDNKRITTIEEGNKGIRKNNTTHIPTQVGFFENEIKRVTDPALINSLREWWKYKK